MLGTHGVVSRTSLGTAMPVWGPLRLGRLYQAPEPQGIWKVPLGEEHWGPWLIPSLFCHPQVSVHQWCLLRPLHEPPQQPEGERPPHAGIRLWLPPDGAGWGKPPGPVLAPGVLMWLLSLTARSSVLCRLSSRVLCFFLWPRLPSLVPLGSLNAVCAWGGHAWHLAVTPSACLHTCSLLGSSSSPPHPLNCPSWPVPWPPPWSLKLVGAPRGLDTHSLHRLPHGPAPGPRPCHARPS